MDVDEIDAVERTKIVDCGLKIARGVRHAELKLGAQRRIVESDDVGPADGQQTSVKFENRELAEDSVRIDVILSRSADWSKEIKCLIIGCRRHGGDAEHAHGRIDDAGAGDA